MVSVSKYLSMDTSGISWTVFNNASGWSRAHVKEKAEKQKGIIPRSAKAEKMPEVVNKILNPTTKQSAVCWWKTHALLHRETHFWSSKCILGTEISWQRMLYGSFQMDHRAVCFKLKGVQCTCESQTTIHILITGCQCFIIPLYL